MEAVRVSSKGMVVKAKRVLKMVTVRDGVGVDS